MSELKPCPFCGKKLAVCCTIAECRYTSEDDDDYDFDASHYTVVCDYEVGGCGAATGVWYDSPEEAIEAWNRRVS